MHLASDYIYPYKDAGGRPTRCPVRIYLPDNVIVLPCTEQDQRPLSRSTTWIGADDIVPPDPGHGIVSLEHSGRLLSPSEHGQIRLRQTP